MLKQLQAASSNFYANPKNLKFLHLLLLGILLRVAIMPFFCHMDALSEGRRVFFWAENYIFLGNIARNTTMFIEVIFYHITSLFQPDANSIFFIEDISKSTSTIPHYYEFVSNHAIFRTLFLLKLPYLFFDIGTAIIIFNFFKEKNNGIRSCVLWLFNPVTIYAFYIFGRFESIPIFFIAAGLLAFKKKNIILAAILIGLCLNGREMMIIYSPIFIAVVLFAPLETINLRKKIISILILLIFTVIALRLYTYVLPQSMGAKVGTVMTEGRVKHLFNFSLHRIMFIPFIYTLILLWISSSETQATQKLFIGCALAMMSFFAFSAHSAHYPSWMIIFPAIFYGYDKRFLWPFVTLCIAWFAHWIFITDLGVFTLWLVSPFSLHFIGIPNIPIIFEEFSGEMGIFNTKMLVYFSRTIFVATLFYMAGLILKPLLKSKNEETF